MMRSARAAAVFFGLMAVEAGADPQSDAAMSAQPANNSINSIELPLADAAATERFYNAAFGWEFLSWGPTYLSFSGAGVDGGFNGDLQPVSGSGPLIVLYAGDLEASLASVEAAGGEVTKLIFGFPGGRRFHVRDPNGTELAVWSE